MVDREKPNPAGRDDLGLAVDAWKLQGDATPLEGWFIRELGEQGDPIRLPLSEWSGVLGRLAEARGRGEGWPPRLDERLTGFFRMLLRFSRPDGRTAGLAPDRTEPESPRKYWRGLLATFREPDVGRVLDWWFPGRDVDPVPPPLPAWSSGDRVLGVLRADWTRRGDFLTFDQRDAGAGTRFELYGAGTPWLSSEWSTPDPSTPSVLPEAAKPTAWATSSNADVAEWSFSSGGRRVTRLAMMLRGRRLAILADQLDGLRPDDAPETRLDVPSGLIVAPLETPGGFLLKTGAPGKSAQAILIGRGALEYEEASRRMIVRPLAEGGDAWLPLLVSWDHARHRKPFRWNRLTVAEQGKVCPPETAWAARVTWGRDETFVVYRSLGPPVRRSFLGFSTTDRFVVGRFTPEGDVEAIATLA
ncbi:hypothetical protein [Planctomyces sp. SH-PL62]|uniref:hypothetical protein n=1 Tax=Planctomyces sp. SH-PL62 TaxID=1636152 RepID=UPI00078B9A00|nr:hypothetical protein [Planctomyces sp. SH-PL62]AMV39898.1 hypothetical protein VT85_20870 [Planctomyces sp. SH-PL62]